jgi:hypothetical protein
VNGSRANKTTNNNNNKTQAKNSGKVDDGMSVDNQGMIHIYRLNLDR